MTPDRLTKILSTAGALTALVVAGLGVYRSWFLNLASWFTPLVLSGIPDWVTTASALFLPAALFAFSVTLTFRAFRRRSILLVPKAFSLDRGRQDQLYGREENIEQLTSILQENDLLFLTGESGVGKTALLRAGLLPILQKSKNIIPIYLSHFGSDWATHPPRNLFAAIRSYLSDDEIRMMGFPTVVNPATVTLADTTKLLDAIPAKVGRIPLVLFDQFDDYQLRFRDRFITAQGVWATAEETRRENPFWDEVASRIGQGALKAIFATRSDEAAGLISVQFQLAASYPLAPPSSEVLAPLLFEIAPATAQPPIVLDPDSGWEQLKLLLLDDLQHSGRVLPQEVRTTLLGLRRLKYLTPTAYNNIGRVEGVKAAFIESAIASAAAAQRVGASAVLKILECMVIPPLSEGEGAKTEGLTSSQIQEKLSASSSLKPADIERVLACLESDEIVRRRREPAVASDVWQLDHDYLATPVLRLTELHRWWSRRLEQGAAAWRCSARNFGAWFTLLSPWEQVRILFERIRGRLRYGQFLDYALLSTLRLVPLVALVALIGFGGSYSLSNLYQERISILTNAAFVDKTSDFRFRLLLLAAALRRGADSWGLRWFVDLDPTKKAIREVLLRSPVYGETFEAAAWNPKGRRIIGSKDDKLIVHDLSSGIDGKPTEVPNQDQGVEGYALKGTQSVGFVGSEGVDQMLGLFDHKGRLLVGEEGSTLQSVPIDVAALEPGRFISRVDFFGDHLRIIVLSFERNIVTRITTLRFSGSAASGFKTDNPGGDEVDWQPVFRSALRLPVLAEDCDAYAFMGRRDSGVALWFGPSGKEANTVPLQATGLSVGVAIARECRAVFVLDDTERLHLIELSSLDQAPRKVMSLQLPLPPEVTTMVVPTVPQTGPLLAAAPLPNERGWRVGWRTLGGLALVDVSGSSQSSLAIQNSIEMLTGVGSIYGSSSLSLSPDGQYAFFTNQQNFNTPLQIRAFNLDFAARRAALASLTTAELVLEACRIAKFQNGTGVLTQSELLFWLGDKNARQPCDETR
jgi:energy-coupling factor transporter ATP-binding protein EcfA2